MAIILVACTEINGGLGDENGELLFKLPKDMTHFKSITTNKTVVFGRKTYESLPVRPLPKRKNIVLTSDKNYKVGKKVTLVHSVEEIIEMGKRKDIYVCGGGDVYRQLIEHSDTLILTHVHTIDLRAKTFFPDISPRDWSIKTSVRHEADDKHPFSFVFATYERRVNTATEEKTEN